MSDQDITTLDRMARWEPGTAARLQQAALELFTTRGFDRTTAGEIAATAGVTERTFYRHFADKREVLFHGQEQFAASFLDVVAAGPPDAGPMDTVAAAVHTAAAGFADDRRTWSRMRQRVIDAHPSLRERERHKLAGLASSIAGALRARGVAEPAATLAAETGATVFRIAFAQWIRDGETRSLTTITEQVFGELTAVVTAVGGMRPAVPTG